MYESLEQESSSSSPERRSKVVGIIAMVALVFAGVVVLSHASARRGGDEQLSKLPRGDFLVSKGSVTDQSALDDGDREPALSADGKRPDRNAKPLMILDKDGKPLADVAGDGSYTIDMANSDKKCTEFLGRSSWAGAKQTYVSFGTGKITVMCFRAGMVLDQIRFSRGSANADLSTLQFKTYGGNGGADQGCFRADSLSQCINKIDVRAGGMVDGMSLYSRHAYKATSKVSRWYGGTGGDYYSIDAGNGKCLEGMTVETVGGIIGKISFCFESYIIL